MAINAIDGVSGINGMAPVPSTLINDPRVDMANDGGTPRGDFD